MFLFTFKKISVGSRWEILILKQALVYRGCKVHSWNIMLPTRSCAHLLGTGSLPPASVNFSCTRIHESEFI